MRKPAIIASIITGSAVILAALIGIYPHIGNQQSEAVVAGIVVDESTKKGIGQATIVIAGRTEQYTTEDSGNFRIDLQTGAPKRLRLHISKLGFEPLDISVAPSESLYLQLRKQ
jgi:hypothetical protein